MDGLRVNIFLMMKLNLIEMLSWKKFQTLMMIVILVNSMKLILYFILSGYFKQEISHLLLKIKKINLDEFSDYMKEIKPNTYTQTKKLICDWSDKKHYLIQYRMLKFYIRHGMKVEKVHNVISFKQSKWLEKYISFNTQKRNKAKNEFEKDFYKILNISFYGRTMENVRNRTKVEFIKKDDTDKIIKQQSKLTFNGIQKSYENYDSYTFKQNEVLMDKPIYLGFNVL